MGVRRRRYGTWLATVTVLLTISAPVGAAEQKEMVAELREPVEVLLDRWGISHIYAHNEHDLFLAQGYRAARDRLFQLELWRRQATGSMAELVGKRAVPADIGARLLQFRGDIKSELNHYHPRGYEIITAFVAGINAYISLTEREPARLSLEFRILGIKPGKWTPEVVISRHNGLFRNATHEIQNAQLVYAIGAVRAVELLNLQPGTPRLEPDRGLDLSLLGDPILETYRSSRAPILFRPEDVEPMYRKPSGGAHEGRGALSAPSQNLVDNRLAARWDEPLEGSNNWVVSGQLTTLRHAIMANDPHRALQLPSLRYWVHLNRARLERDRRGRTSLAGRFRRA